MKVFPATDRVPLRAAAVELAETEKFTVPLATLLLLEVIMSQEALLTAVQEHPGGAVTLTRPVPPVDGTDCEVGDKV